MLTLFPFSINDRSQTATSVANLLNSFTCDSRSEDHLFTISSIVFPLSIEGGWAVIVRADEVPKALVLSSVEGVVPTVMGLTAEK